MFAENDPAIAEPGTIAPVPAPVPINKAQGRIDLINVVGIAFVGLIVAALLLKIATRYRSQIDEPDEMNSSVSMSSFREMYESGEITQDEYDRLRDKLAAKIKGEVGKSNPSQLPRLTPKPPVVPPPVGSDVPPPPPETD